MSSSSIRVIALIGSLCFWALCSTHAADITLTDGTVLENAEVKGETPDTVYIQYGDQYESFPRNLVPSQYLEKNVEWAEATPAPSQTSADNPFSSSKSTSNNPFGSSPAATETSPLPATPSTSSGSEDGKDTLFSFGEPSPASSATPATGTEEASAKTFSLETLENIFREPLLLYQSPEIQEQTEKLTQKLKDDGKLKFVVTVAILIAVAGLFLSSLIFGLIYWPVTALFSVEGRGYGKCFLIVLLASLLGLVPYAAPFFHQFDSTPMIAIVIGSFLTGPILAALIFRQTPFRGFFSYFCMQAALMAISIGVTLALPSIVPELQV